MRDLTKVLQQREKEAQTARFAVPEKVTLDNMLPVEDLERLLTKVTHQAPCNEDPPRQSRQTI